MADPQSESSPGFRRYRIPLLFLVVIVASVLLLGVGELAARIAMPQWAPANAERSVFWAYHDVLGWAHIPGQHGRFLHRDFAIDVRINSRGQRDDEYPLERSSKKRMLVIGDSFGWGFGVELRERFSEILEGRHPGWEIINASVSGYGTDQEYLYLKNWGMQYRPDVVLLEFYRNDFDENVSFERNSYFKPFFTLDADALQLRNVPVPRPSVRQKLDQFFFGRTYLLAKLYASALETRSLVRARLAGDRRPRRRGYPPLGPKDHLVTMALLRAMNELCREAGVKLIVIGIPMEPEREALLSEFVAKEGISYFSLDPAFKGVTGPVTHPHDLHWNVRGHAIAAAAIDQYLAGLGLFQ